MKRTRLLLSPALMIMSVFFLAFTVFAGAGLLHAAAGTPGYMGPVTLSNYVRFLGNPQAMGVLAWTLAFSAEVTLATILIGYPFAYLVARTSSDRLRKGILGLLIMTFLTGAISRAYGWMILLGKHGMINDVLVSSGVIERPLALIYNVTGVFISLLHFVLPFFILTILGSIRKVPRRLEEAARDLGAGSLRTFFLIVLPLTLPAVVNGASLVFSLSISAFVFPLLLGGGRVALISNYIYDQLFVSFNLPYAAAASLIFLITAIVVMMLFYGIEASMRRVVYRGGK